VFICAVGSGAIDKEGNRHIRLDLMSEDEVDRAVDELSKQLEKARIKGKKEIRKNKDKSPYRGKRA